MSSLQAENFQLSSAKLEAERVEKQRSIAEKVQLSPKLAKLQEQMTVVKMENQSCTMQAKKFLLLSELTKLKAERLEEQRSAA